MISRQSWGVVTVQRSPYSRQDADMAALPTNGQKDAQEARSDDYEASGSVWEPWLPKMCQRVRVVMSSECPYFLPDTPERGHCPEENGMTGMVTRIVYAFGPYPDGPLWPGHRFYVQYDNVVVVKMPEPGYFPVKYVGGAWAAIELEPLGDTPCD